MKLFCWHVWAKGDPDRFGDDGYRWWAEQCAKCGKRKLLKYGKQLTLEHTQEALAWLKGDD